MTIPTGRYCQKAIGQEHVQIPLVKAYSNYSPSSAVPNQEEVHKANIT